MKRHQNAELTGPANLFIHQKVCLITLRKAVLAFVTLVAFTILFIDKPLVQLLDSYQSASVSQFFSVLTKAGESGFWFSIAFGLMLTGWLFTLVDNDNLQARRVMRFGGFCFSTLALTGLIVVLAKYLIGRTRPELMLEQNIYQLFPLHQEYTAQYCSMPSGHTQTIFTVAFLLMLVTPQRLHRGLFVAAAIIGFSRVMVFAHWPSDVLVGAAVGIVIPAMFFRYCQHRQWFHF